MEISHSSRLRHHVREPGGVMMKALSAVVVMVAGCAILGAAMVFLWLIGSMLSLGLWGSLR